MSDPFASIAQTYEVMKNKLFYIERRAMERNLKAFEAVRQVIGFLDDWKPEKDPTWVLRSCRDVMIDYLRALSKYTGMKCSEKSNLVHLVMFEAAYRHLQSNLNKEEHVAKYKLTVEICDAIEEQEQSYYTSPGSSTSEVEVRLFSKETMSFAAVMKGYKENPAYCWLKDHAGLEAKFELQSIVGEAADLVKLRTEQILLQNNIQPDAKRQRTSRDSKMTDAGSGSGA